MIPYMRGHKAEAGIGTLILFISLIMVAAIAAGILLQSAQSFQNKALLTGTKAQSSVSTHVDIIYAHGKDASAAISGKRVLNRTFIKIKLGAGSDPIKFSDVAVEYSSERSSSSLRYNSSINCSLEGKQQFGLFNLTTNPNNATYYGIRYLMGGQTQGYLANLGRQDVVEICFPLPQNLGEGEKFSISIVPKNGQASRFETKTPDTMLSQRVQLFP